jgi:hypothetical protein
MGGTFGKIIMERHRDVGYRWGTGGTIIVSGHMSAHRGVISIDVDPDKLKYNHLSMAETTINFLNTLLLDNLD